jgi:tRNA threonylcarbamoyladenosine biosynthesis protein TsaE
MNFDGVKLVDLESVAGEIVKVINQSINNSFLVYLEGEMGAGKTTLAQNIGKSLGVKDHMQSPTFTLMREYNLENSKYKKLLHIDAYRFENKKEWQVLKINENKIDNVTLIEWPSNMIAPQANMIIEIKKVSQDVRDIKIKII